eukprot:snap_masked-scaffold_2-processed-gene-14.9-mRNA-1 protein AED:1.00 eAED:1.00 QI:0/0/0/0/1/1/2/0/68
MSSLKAKAIMHLGSLLFRKAKDILTVFTLIMELSRKINVNKQAYSEEVVFTFPENFVSKETNFNKSGK